MADLVERKSLKLLAQAGQTLNQIVGEGLCDEPQKDLMRRILTDIPRIPQAVEHDLPSDRGASQRNSNRSRPDGSENGETLGLPTSELAALPSSGRTSAVVDRRIRPDPRSCRRGRCPQPGDQRQDIREHPSRNRDLGHLERHVAPMADHLGAHLDRMTPDHSLYTMAQEQVAGPHVTRAGACRHRGSEGSRASPARAAERGLASCIRVGALVLEPS